MSSDFDHQQSASTAYDPMQANPNSNSNSDPTMNTNNGNSNYFYCFHVKYFTPIITGIAFLFSAIAIFMPRWLFFPSNSADPTYSPFEIYAGLWEICVKAANGDVKCDDVDSEVDQPTLAFPIEVGAENSLNISQAISKTLFFFISTALAFTLFLTVSIYYYRYRKSKLWIYMTFIPMISTLLVLFMIPPLHARLIEFHNKIVWNNSLSSCFPLIWISFIFSLLALVFQYKYYQLMKYEIQINSTPILSHQDSNSNI